MKWLDLVQMRPGMYLGVSAPYFGALFERLEGMIVGYTLAVQAHDVPDAGVDLLLVVSLVSRETVWLEPFRGPILDYPTREFIRLRGMGCVLEAARGLPQRCASTG